MINFHYRVAKYDSALWDEHDLYTREEWFGEYDVGEEIGGHVLTEDEYRQVENKYLYVVEKFASESGVDWLSVLDLTGSDDRWPDLGDGVRLRLNDAIELVRGMLREGAVNAHLEVEDRFYVHVGDRMHMWIGSHQDCVQSVAEAERIGLFVDRGVASPMWNLSSAERFWWLKEGVPVRYRLGSFDRQSGESLEKWDIPEERVSALRDLFVLKRYDPNFYDSYKVDEARRERVGQILGMTLDPGRVYVVSTHSAE